MVGVDSAEADKVGSRGFRFCAYVGSALYQGAQHRRTALARCERGRFCGVALQAQATANLRSLPSASLLSDIGHSSASATKACMASAAFTSFIRDDRGFCIWIPRR